MPVLLRTQKEKEKKPVLLRTELLIESDIHLQQQAELDGLLAILLLQLLRCQHLYFCTSTASKLSTSLLVSHQLVAAQVSAFVLLY